MKDDTVSNETLTVLMIDDNKDLAIVICQLIETLGYIASAAFNGTEGIAKAKELRPNVVICDIGLPGMSGYEVAKIISNDAQLKDTFLIALSGYALPKDVELSIEAGFNRHLGKPVDIETLEQVLHDVR